MARAYGRETSRASAPTCAAGAIDARMLYGRARLSGPRTHIAQAVLAMPGAFTAEDLDRTLRVQGRHLGLATVYRALGAMQDAGAVAIVGERTGSSLYARCGRSDHHHHLVCTSCGCVVAVDCPLDAAAEAVAAAEGHLVLSHQITLYGLCANCRHDTAGT